MKRFLKQWFPWLLFAGVALGGTIHTFANGTVLDANDLNQALQHIHNQMVGGHGARLVNADVSTSAAISQIKITNGLLIPRAWGTTEAVCTSGACTLAASANMTSLTRVATGIYTGVMNYTPTDAHFMVVTSSSNNPTANAPCRCVDVHTAHSTTNPMFTVHCWDGAQDGGAQAKIDCNFGFVVTDNN